MADEVGQLDLRKEVVDKVLKGFATASYKFKQAVSVVSTSAWDNTYYTEASGALTGQGYGSRTTMIKHIPRGAAFPQASVNWTKRTKWIEKYGLEENIFWEDIISDNIDVQSRTLFRISEGIVKAVDDEMWDTLTESQSPSEIQNFSIWSTTAADAGRTWDVASAAIIDDLMKAKQLIGQFNYPTNNLMCFISEKDHRSIVKYLTDSGAQFPSIGADVATNGRVGNLAGINLVVSNSVTASYALVCVPKICATWKELKPLQSEVTVDPFKSVRVRAVEMGVLQLTDPKSCVLITGTNSGTTA